jgi:amino acid transporter
MTLHAPRARAVASQGATSRDAGLNGGPGGGRDSGHELGVLGGLAALSLDALTSVAYGPQAMIVILVLAGGSALRWTVPLTIVIAAILVILVFSYTQVISAHPEGGGAYAVAKANLGRPASLLAAASLVVDYVLTVAVSLAVGAASLASVFPALAHHLLLVSLVALVILTTVNMFGIAASAKLLIVPGALFVISILAVLVVAPFHSKPVAVIGTYPGPIVATKTVGLLLLHKAFANGCTAITGVEAIANGVPAFRRPRVRAAQRTELALGVLLGVMLIGLAVLIRAHGVVPRGNVTILAQLTAGTFGKGAVFYVCNLSVALALGLAANTSFGGLPVLMELLAKDNRLPHVFYLRAERPIYRYGIVTLALAAALLLVVVDAQTERLIPLFTIGVFIGFTISQLGLVRLWLSARPSRWRKGGDQRPRGDTDRDRSRGGAADQVPGRRVGCHDRDSAADRDVCAHGGVLRRGRLRTGAWEEPCSSQETPECRDRAGVGGRRVDRPSHQRCALARREGRRSVRRRR